MASNIVIIFMVVALVSSIAYIADLQQHPEITLRTEIEGYTGDYEQGTAINTPASPTNTTEDDSLIGSIFGFAFDIPIIGQVLEAISWFISIAIFLISSVWAWLGSIIALFGILPIFMSGIVAFLVIWVLTMVYKEYMVGK